MNKVLYIQNIMCCKD